MRTLELPAGKSSREWGRIHGESFRGEVRALAPIEGSDKLWLVDVFDGERTRRVVCGASNFSVGDRVPAALPGAELPGGLRIERRRIFGQTSDGMLASVRELGIADDHRGILVLGDTAPIGEQLDRWLDLDDAVFDIEVTPDRGYLLSILGVARDVAALTGAKLSLPEAVPPGGDEAPVPITIEDSDRCRRFDVRAIRAWVERAGFHGFIEVEIFSKAYWEMDQQQFLSRIVDAYRAHV